MVAPRLDPVAHARRLVAQQRNIILPARVLVVAAVLYHVHTSAWLGNVVNTYGVVVETIQNILLAYAMVVLAATVLFYVVRQFPAPPVQWIVFGLGLADGVFLGGLTVLTGGFESILYWVFPGLIVLNAISIPLAMPQIVLNLILGIFFLSAGLVERGSQQELMLGSLRRFATHITVEEVKDPARLAAWLGDAPEPVAKTLRKRLSETTLQSFTNAPSTPTNTVLIQALTDDLNRLFFGPKGTLVSEPPLADLPETAASPYILRVAVLVLLTFCCYGVQALAAGQRRAEEEHKEFVLRTEQLRSAGRLAAEVAHQIKNPLAIINNCTFSLLKKFAKETPAAAQQIELIREEVAKADRIITQIMGYAQLTEGRVEKLNVVDELNRVIAEVFPPGVPTETRIHRDFERDLPALLMQRKHFSEAISNLLQNARDALENRGNVFLTARSREDYSVAITVRDDGPGIPGDKLERIFEAYYTTRPRGTGLGLAVVKHNAELYGGAVRVQSELGNGATFTILFPARTLMQPGS
jgi:signal transduction histidine kinase